LRIATDPFLRFAKTDGNGTSIPTGNPRIFKPRSMALSLRLYVLEIEMKGKLLVLVAVLIGASLMVYFVSNRSTSDPNVIRVSGNIEVTDAEVSLRFLGGSKDVWSLKVIRLSRVS
jgi:hypothetical protein